MTVFMENWYICIALMAVTAVIGVEIWRFLKLPTRVQIDTGMRNGHPYYVAADGSAYVSEKYH